jgi:transcriptional regulator with XRE-family HTH domain
MALSELRRARLDSGRTLFDISVLTEIGTSRLSMLERGLLASTPDEQERLARALNRTVSQLFPPRSDDSHP